MDWRYLETCNVTDLKRDDFQSLTAGASNVFPPEMAVTKVAWCMNAGFTGWYAAGMGCGLVRIENLNSKGS